VLRIAFHILLTVAVLGFATVVEVLFIRDPVTDWKTLFRRIVSLDGRLVGLSHDDIFSEGLSEPRHEGYDFIGGWRGLLAIYHNIAVLTDISAYLKRVCAPSPWLKQTRWRLLSRAVKARLFTITALTFAPLPFGARIAQRIPALKAYQSLVANTCLAVSDHCPEVLAQLERSLREGHGD
jgi:hypothetical protein